MERTGTDKRKKEMVVMPGLKHDIFHEKQPDGNTYRFINWMYESKMMNIGNECIKVVVNYFDRCYEGNKPLEEGV